MRTQRTKTLAGDLYDALDPALSRLPGRARPRPLPGATPHARQSGKAAERSSDAGWPRSPKARRSNHALPPPCEKRGIVDIIVVDGRPQPDGVAAQEFVVLTAA